MKAKAFFEAQGRSAASRGLSITAGRGRRLTWPVWARSAWARGWLAQTNRWPSKGEGVAGD